MSRQIVSITRENIRANRFETRKVEQFSLFYETSILKTRPVLTLVIRN